MLLALVASALVVFGSPYIGQVRGAMESAFPQFYRLIVGGTVAVTIAAAIASAVVGIRRHVRLLGGARDRRLDMRRYWLIAAAVIVGAVYAQAVRSGNPDLDLVELFHFVEYGLITYLFHRAWRHQVDVGALVLPVCAALVVALADELVQWFVPGRVGELHDVWLDCAAIVCGLLFSVAVHPPGSLVGPVAPRARRALRIALVAVVLVIAAFVDRVHLGYEIRDAEVGTFLSQYDAADLIAASAERAVRWRSGPPASRGFTREDHYFSEGLWHVQRRNLAESERELHAAWNENLILGKYFRPVLDLGFQWPSAQLAANAPAARDSIPAAYVSRAAPYPIYAIDRRVFWSLAALAVAAIQWSLR